MNKPVYWYMRGRLDHQDRTPWKRAPMSESEWRDTGRETPEQQSYWDGFNGGVHDVLKRRRSGDSH
jgi:hypothetical protein